MKFWQDMTREQIKEAASNNSVVLLTIGATEQHGPHLNVDVDNEIVKKLAVLSVEKASNYVPVIRGPHIDFGYSPHHFQYAGAISLSVKTLLSLIHDVIESIIKSGFKKIFLLNSHGGNGEIIRIAVKEIHQKYDDIFIGAGSYWEVADNNLEKYKTENKLYDVGHAGQFETSLMLSICEEKVWKEKLFLADGNREEISLLFDPYIKLGTENIWKKWMVLVMNLILLIKNMVMI